MSRQKQYQYYLDCWLSLINEARIAPSFAESQTLYRIARYYRRDMERLRYW